ncbi:MAG: uroporphyrinogen-III synthase [Croceitalea sp.]|nr:uroporphyrinogen-III synthase [Croceitalea sp.]NNM18448.1 uroporphyrinogen-III synthase [Croceitalea sp.]
MSTILSTKILSPNQQELLLNAGIGFVHYDAIQIELLNFELPQDFDILICTSQNAVKAFIAKFGAFDMHRCKTLCVGDKTGQLLLDHGANVLYAAENAKQLAKYIKKEHATTNLLYLSGNIRRDELPNSLKKAGIKLTEIIVYNTQLWPRQFEREFDGVLFYSPSGVRSFMAKNDLKNAKSFCIGETTAAELKLYTDNYIIAEKATVENVLVKAINYCKTND